MPPNKIPNPTAEDIDKYHQMYVDRLRGIYDKYKDEFAPDRRSSMRVVH